MLSHFLRAVQKTPTDPFFDQTTLLLHGDGTNGAQNNTFVSTTSSPYSYYINSGSSSFLEVAGYTGTVGQLPGNFTYEAWVYPTSYNSPVSYVMSAGDDNGGYGMGITPSGVPFFSFYVSGPYVSSISGGSAPLNTWTHIACVRNGTTINLYVNGISVNSATMTATQNVTGAFGSFLKIGRMVSSGSFTYPFFGNISNLRIVKGTAVYTANFVPPTAPLTAISGTTLLTCQSPTIIDNSSNGFAITNSGATVTSSINPTGGISGNPVNWYGTFNGSFQYLTAPYISGFNVGTGNFTLECWVYLTSVSGIRGICGTNPNYASGGVGLYVDNGVVVGQVLANSPAADTVVGPSTISANTWYHLALVRSSGTLTLYVNGVAGTSVSSSINPNNTSVFWLGTYSGTGYQLTGRLSNVRFVVGTAVYTANFTPPQGTIPSITNTQLLALQSGAIVDSSPNIAAITNYGNVAMTPGYWQLTRNGNTTQGSFSPFSNAPTAWGNYFDGNGDYLSYDSSNATNFGTGDFTVELFVYLTNTGTYSTFVRSNDVGTTIDFGYDFGAGQLKFEARNATFLFAAATTMPTQQWVHVAASRSGTSFRAFINGTQVGSTTTSSTNWGSSATSTIGGSTFSTAHSVNGYISNLRILKGTAQYTANFTPPTTPFTAITNTTLLTCQSNRFVDNSANNFTITRNGDVQVRPFGPFNPTSAYSTTLVGGSGYFDGTGDYLVVPNSDSLNLESGDFTVEAWFYTTSSSATRPIVVRFDGDAGTRSDLQFFIGIISGNLILSPYSGTTNYDMSFSSVPLNQWNHCALVRTGNTFYAYLNGVRNSTTQTITGNLNNGTWETWVGGYKEGGVFSYQLGYIGDVRILKGTAQYTGSTYTVPTAPLTPVTNTSLMLNYVNAGIFDNTARNDLETVGNAQISTSVKKFGTGSLYFDGNGDYLLAPSNVLYNFGTENFTIECWLYQTARTAGEYDTVWTLNGPGVTGGTTPFNSGMYLTLGAAGGNFLVSNAAENAWAVNISLSLPTLNTWEHWAVVRNGSTFTVYQNGTSIGTATSSAAINNNRSPFAIGVQGPNTTFFEGYIDDLRVTKGVARYTANFTPPTSAFPDL